MKFNSLSPPVVNPAQDTAPLCRVAAPVSITISSPGATIDGVTLSNGDRVLLYSQTSGTENGFYTFNGSGSPMTRSTSVLVKAGMLAPISEGTLNADKIFQLTTNGSIVLDTTTLVFAGASGGASLGVIRASSLGVIST